MSDAFITFRGLLITLLSLTFFGSLPAATTLHTMSRSVIMPRSEPLLVTIRLPTVAVLALLATSVSYLVLITQITPVSYGLTLAVLYLAAIIYGAVGILIGSLISGQLEGSFALLFFFVEEAFVSTPLFGSQGFPFLPTYYPSQILSAMVAERSHDAVHWIYAALYGLATLILAFMAFYRAARLR